MDLNASKALAMAGLGAGGLLAGLLPFRLAAGSPTLKRSSLLCFGGGVLLAASLLHLLPESRKALPNYADICYCVGFLVVYFLDEIAQFISFSAPVNPPEEANESTALLSGCPREEGPNVAHMGGLIVALSAHALFEGLAVGSEDHPTKVLLLFGAIACHKFVVGFCLGAELMASRDITFCRFLTAISAFSLSSVAGIGIGMAVEGTEWSWKKGALGGMQAVAGGTLLYVTLGEVLPRERAKWCERRRAAGILQFIALLIGFSLMFAIDRYLDPDSGPEL